MFTTDADGDAELRAKTLVAGGTEGDVTEVMTFARMLRAFARVDADTVDDPPAERARRRRLAYLANYPGGELTNGSRVTPDGIMRPDGTLDTNGTV